MAGLLRSLKLDCYEHCEIESRSLSCCWGPILWFENDGSARQRLFFTKSQNGSKGKRHLVVLAAFEFPSREAVQPETLQDGHASNTGIHEEAYIGHPGEVNRMRPLGEHPHLLVTSTDDQYVRVFNTDKSSDRAHLASKEPHLTLEGNKERAYFALATSGKGSLVASGTAIGEKAVRVWDVADHASAAERDGKHRSVQPRAVFYGHEKGVEDVCFNPGERSQLASVGEDGKLLLYDQRRGKGPARSIPFSGDYQCQFRVLDWCPTDTNYVAIGDADGILRVVDLRAPRTSLWRAKEHNGEILSLEWNLDRPGLVATAGEDGCVNIWQLHGREYYPDGSPPFRSKYLAFSLQTRGQVNQAAWNPQNSLAMLHVSNEGYERAGAVEVWKPWELILLPNQEALSYIRSMWDKIASSQ